MLMIYLNQLKLSNRTGQECKTNVQKWWFQLNKILWNSKEDVETISGCDGKGTGECWWKSSEFFTCLSFHWLSVKFTTEYPVLSYLTGIVFMIIWQMFHGRICLNSVLLLVFVNFVSGFKLELMYISLIISIRSILVHLHGFHLLELLP